MKGRLVEGRGCERGDLGMGSYSPWHVWVSPVSPVVWGALLAFWCSAEPQAPLPSVCSAGTELAYADLRAHGARRPGKLPSQGLS